MAQQQLAVLCKASEPHSCTQHAYSMGVAGCCRAAGWPWRALGTWLLETWLVARWC